MGEDQHCILGHHPRVQVGSANFRPGSSGTKSAAVLTTGSLEGLPSLIIMIHEPRRHTIPGTILSILQLLTHSVFLTESKLAHCSLHDRLINREMRC